MLARLLDVDLQAFGLRKLSEELESPHRVGRDERPARDVDDARDLLGGLARARDALGHAEDLDPREIRDDEEERDQEHASPQQRARPESRQDGRYVTGHERQRSGGHPSVSLSHAARREHHHPSRFSPSGMNTYPKPHTVWMNEGFAGSGSTRRRR